MPDKSSPCDPKQPGAHPEHLLRIAEAASRLALSERSVWTLLRTGALPLVRIGRATRVRASDIERLMREGLPAEGSNK